MNAWVCICSEEYLGYYKVLYDSLNKYTSPYDKKLLYFIGKNPPKDLGEVIDITEWKTNYTDQLERICSLRARVVLDAFIRGYDKVVFLGAKIEVFNKNVSMIFDLLDRNNAIGTYHILEPLPDDGFFPSNASVSFTGHVSTDYVAFKKAPEVIDFLYWLDETLKTKCKTTSQTYLDQSWLNFMPCFIKQTHVMRHEGTNVAYWNMFQRGMHKTKEGWRMKRGEYLHSFQYSGLDLENPENVSKHQNRYRLEKDSELYGFLKDYSDRVKSYVRKP